RCGTCRGPDRLLRNSFSRAAGKRRLASNPGNLPGYFPAAARKHKADTSKRDTTSRELRRHGEIRPGPPGAPRSSESWQTNRPRAEANWMLKREATFAGQF